jgi:hypothetical protein
LKYGKFMNNGTRLPLWRDCKRLLLEIEKAVRQFPRYHEYAVGADIRRTPDELPCGAWEREKFRLAVSKVIVRPQGNLKGGLHRRCVESLTFLPSSQTGVSLCAFFTP